MSTAAVAEPATVPAWLRLAQAQQRRGNWAAAAQAARHALALDPRCAAALHSAADSLEQLGRHGELAALLLAADLTAAGDVRLQLRLSVALTRLGRFQEAVTALFDVLQRDRCCSAAFAQLGNVFQLLQLPQEARESFRTALALGRAPVEMLSAMAFTALEAASWHELAPDLAQLQALIDAGHGHALPFYSLNFSADRAGLRAAASAHAQRLFQGIRPLPAAPRRALTAPLRLGYVSSDFHAHATAYLIADLFESHDPDRLQIYAYSYGIDDGSPMRQRIAAAFGTRFVEARAMSSAALAQRIRQDGIDVLIDLKGYTLYARNDIFAYRPAPIQVNFLGFPGTLGSAHYDYLIADRITAPLEHAADYAEKIAQLPHCYQPNDRRRPQGAVLDRADCGLPPDAVVLASFNANYKITPAVFDRWCAVLRAVDDAVLWLYLSNEQARRNLQLQAQRRGVDPGRLYWAAPLPQAEHLARLPCADLFLDTTPVNAHTSASDALWAGLPLLTVIGAGFAARVAASLLLAAGVPELIAHSLDEYQAKACSLAQDRRRLRALRQRLLANRDQCALFDTPRYVRDFESLLARMVARQRRGLAPAHLPA